VGGGTTRKDGRRNGESGASLIGGCGSETVRLCGRIGAESGTRADEWR
jgi:hypothetical protein